MRRIATNTILAAFAFLLMTTALSQAQSQTQGQNQGQTQKVDASSLLNDSAPQEPPYTQPNNEFEDSQKIESELTKGKASTTTPTSLPPSQAAPKKETIPTSQAPTSADSKSSTVEPSKRVVIKPEPTVESANGKASGARVEKIKHPQSSKGLIRIEPDGTYVYKTEQIKPVHTSSFRFGVFQPPNIVSADKSTNFKSMYGSGNVFAIFFNYERVATQLLGENFRYQFDLGFFTAQGSGRFLYKKDGSTACSGSLSECQAHEKYTFYALPLSAGISYHFRISDRQWLVPYAVGGLTYFGIIENRDDSKSFHAVGTPGGYGGGGLMFNISNIGKNTAYVLKSEYKIANLWLTLDARYFKSISSDLDFSSSVATLGFAFDY